MIELNPIFIYRGNECKKCNICHKILPLTRFSKSSIKKSGYRGDCKSCQQITKRKWSNTNYHRDYEKNRKLISTYGITLKDFRQKLECQEYKCEICKCTIADDKHTHVDHCHTTGKVRGLLCSKCNHAMGLVNENTTTLHNMINYIGHYYEAK